MHTGTWTEAAKVQTMLAHETIRDLLSESLTLMADIVPLLAEGKGTENSGDLGVRYDAFLAKLAGLRQEDPRLADEAWDWIWSGSGEFKTGTAEETAPSPMKLYGRLSFINTEIFHFL